MKNMSVQDLVQELNGWAEENYETYTEDKLLEVHFHVYDLFMKHCGEAPEFEIGPRGQVKVLKPSFR